MVKAVSPQDLKAWLSDGQELALIDVREYGQYGEAHPFFAIPIAYSNFEARLGDLMPNPRARMVLVDEGDGIATRAAQRAEAMGYRNVHSLEGGAPAWSAAGYTLYAGVNVPSKTFGELLELARHTPRLSADEVARMQQSEADLVIIDGRPYGEYTRFSIPGGICCPNGELVHRIDDLVPGPETTIVVNCAGRTRSILGAQTLIDAGITNPVYALENGTQGWFLAGLELDRGATRRYTNERTTEYLDARRQRVRALAENAGVQFITAEEAGSYIADDARTTYLIDVRTAEEFAQDGIAGSRHAPGGQLVQATDQWVGVRGARIVLMDDDMLRAPMAANWLRQLGHGAFVIEGGISAVRAAGITMASAANDNAAGPRALKVISTGDVRASPGCQLVDLRGSMAFRETHIAGAHWSIRPRLGKLGLDPARPVVLIGDAGTVALAGVDLIEAGYSDIAHMQGSPDNWRSDGLDVVAATDMPADEDCIDFLFFTSERHSGSEAASRQYLEWEIGLVDQLDRQERETFRIIV